MIDGPAIQFRRRRRFGRAACVTAVTLLAILALTARVGVRATLPLNLELTLVRGRLSVERPRLPQPVGVRTYLHRDGLSLGFDGHRYNAGWWFVRLPLWALAAPIGAVGAWALWATRAVRRWPSEGRCAACGYQLAGLPSKVCPECGKPA